MTRLSAILRKTIFSVYILCLCCFSSAHLYAELLTSPTFGYAIDLPEGFNFVDKTSDNKRYLFTYSLLPVQLAITVYDSSFSKSSKDALGKSLKKVGAQGDIDSVIWRHTECALSNFTMKTSDNSPSYKGWATAVYLQQKKDYLILLCFAPKKNITTCEQVILSVLDSLMIDSGSYHESGLITKYAYQNKNPTPITINIDGTTINTTIDKEDSEGSLFVIQREYAILTMYANQKNWEEAWQRYYRMIYRDSCGRLKRPAFDIYTSLYTEAVQANSKDINLYITKKLLKWVQGFKFIRDSNNADFVPIIDALQSKPCDCDCRSLLLCTILKQYGIDSMLFISKEYSHAVFGVDLNAKGAVIKFSGKNFLLGETTAHVTLGLIAQTMSDPTKWIPVELYK